MVMIMRIHNPDSQITDILEHLQTGAEITPLEALNKYGAYRLGAIIYNLRQEGYNILTRMEYYTKPSGRKGRYAVYRLEDSKV